MQAMMLNGAGGGGVAMDESVIRCPLSLSRTFAQSQLFSNVYIFERVLMEAGGGHLLAAPPVANGEGGGA